MSCSSFRKNNIVARSFDFYYNENPSIVVKTLHTEDHFASIGVAGSGVGDNMGALTQKNIINNTTSQDSKDMLPYMLVDGINENHVYINQNVLTPDTKYGITSGTNPGKPRCCINFFLRTILDKATSAKHAIQICNDYDLYSIKSDSFHYETHYMICDLNETYIVEFINNQLVYHGPSGIESVPGYQGELIRPIMTNFYITGWNGIMPELPTRSLDEEDTNGLLRYSCGCERYKILQEGLENVDSLTTAKELINKVKYTYSYTNEIGPDFWYTEFVDGDWTIATSHDDPEVISFINHIKEVYPNRKRDSKFWLSNHQCVYDIENLKLIIEPQESGEEFEYNL